MLNMKVTAQFIPNYEDRIGIIKSDSIQTFQSLSLSASEGFINPDEYFIGPGDILNIQLIGIETFNYRLQVDPEGNLLIPRIGSVNLQGNTLSQSKETIISFINKSFKDVTTFVTLENFRSIKVTIVGDVVNSSTFTFKSNTRLFDAVSKAGLLKTSDIRNIKLINNNSEENIDLLNFIRTGNKKHNPYLFDGTVIRINKVDKFVSIFGAVLYPGNYEFVNDESILDLVKIAGGFTHNAKADSIELVSFASDNKTLESTFLNMDELQNHQIKKFDKIIVREKVDYFTERLVRVDGFVNYPGYHKIVKGKTKLSEMILNSAGGFREEASLKDAYVIRTIGSDEIDAEFERLKTIPIADMTEDEYDYFKARSREEKGRIVLDFRKLFLENDFSEDLILKRGDVIYIPEAKDYVTLVGQVVRPGNLIYKENLSVDDYINLAGGFAWRAIEDDVRVIKSESGEWIEADEVESLSPGDIIWIPEDPPAPPFWETFKDVLSITGQLATVITAIVAIIVASR